MGELLDLVTGLHKKTQRAYLDRMLDDKVFCMQKAKQYGQDYWDGDRRFGYGGYHYISDWWKPVAEALIDRYKLDSFSRLLDIGCGKSFLLYEIQRINPDIELVGLDVSGYALDNQHPSFEGRCFQYDARNKLPFDDDEFDLVISLGTLHNFKLHEVYQSLKEMKRVGAFQYLTVESYRNEFELFNLECWALTAESLLDPDEWGWMFKEAGYSGDFEFIYFE
mgnify:CR=1 FL=1